MLRRVTSRKSTTSGGNAGRAGRGGNKHATAAASVSDAFFPSVPSSSLASSGAVALPGGPPSSSSLLPNHSHSASTSDAAVVIERVRLTIPNAHVFKLPPKPNANEPWRGADWKDKMWQGTLKVVERGDQTAVLLVDAPPPRGTHTATTTSSNNNGNNAGKENVFAVCPIRDEPPENRDGDDNDAKAAQAARQSQPRCIDRCVDSSRYFVLRIENAQGRHMFIGLAFNERNDAFDFNIALEDSRREKEAERRAARKAAIAASGIYENEGLNGEEHPSKDYRIKKGEKIRVAIPTRVDSQEEGEEEDGHGSEWCALNGDGAREAVTSSGVSAAERRRNSKKAQGQSKGGRAGAGGFLKPSSKDTPSRMG